MGLVRRQAVGDGMDIIGRGRKITITIEEILDRGYGTSRVKLRIEGIPDISELEIAAQQPASPLGDGVTVGVSTSVPYDSKRVGINYTAPADYVLNRREH